MMRTKAHLVALLGTALMLEGQSQVGTYNPLPPIKLKPPILFKDQEGVINTIKDYRLIQEGKSRKGKVKQARIIARVEQWLKDGVVTEEDIKGTNPTC